MMDLVSQVFEQSLSPPSQSFISSSSFEIVPSRSYWRPYEFAAVAFKAAINTISDELHIFLEADIALKQLRSHKEQLRRIHACIFEEKGTITERHGILLASFWTMLGGNRRELHRLDDSLKRLGTLDQYHQRMLAYVGGTQRQLRTMRSEWLNFRNRAISTSQHIPVQIHMRSLTNGLDRLTLQQGKIKGKEQKEGSPRDLEPDRALRSVDGSGDDADGCSTSMKSVAPQE
jgi:hypothetical protein